MLVIEVANIIPKIAIQLFEKATENIKQGDQILLQVGKSFVIKKVRAVSSFKKKHIHKAICNLEGDN